MSSNATFRPFSSDTRGSRTSANDRASAATSTSSNRRMKLQSWLRYAYASRKRPAPTRISAVKAVTLSS